ncbi:MAG: hypothetical protein E7496_01010 [Ruminococcus sp.]|nr:hypothetical protein [Ruminococcus sp.]
MDKQKVAIGIIKELPPDKLDLFIEIFSQYADKGYTETSEKISDTDDVLSSNFFNDTTDFDEARNAYLEQRFGK